MAHDLPVQDGVVKGHGNVVLRLEPDGCLQLAAVIDLGKAEGPHGHPLTRKPHAHRLRELAVGEELLERIRESFWVSYLSLAEDARSQWDDPELAHGGVAVDSNLGRRHAAGLDV